MSTSAFRLISESESTRFAGVTLDTLRQYERFGLLQCVRKDNEVFYRENDLRTVFGVNDSARAPEGRTEQPSTSTPNAQPAYQPQTASTESPQQSTVDGTTSAAPHEQPAAVEPQLERPRSNETPHFQPQNTQFDSGVTYSHPQSPGVFEMLESNRTLRDQIQILKDERDWLRKRVEKLETRTERDQMLLIAENETVKGLMHQLPAPAPRPSFWRIALPWLRPEK